ARARRSGRTCRAALRRRCTRRRSRRFRATSSPTRLPFANAQNDPIPTFRAASSSVLPTTVVRLRTSRRHRARSLVRMWRVALQSVHHARLSRAQGDPVLRGVLERNEERLGTPQRLLAQVLPPFELELEGELADERPVITPSAPERDVRQGGRPVPEVQDADVLEHLLDDRVRDDLD